MSVFTKIGKIVSQSLDDLLQSEGDGARKGRETVNVGYRSGRFKGSSDSLIKIARIGVGATIIVGTGYVIFQVGKAIFIYAKDRIFAKEKIIT